MIRTRSRIWVQTLKRCKDGSCLVRVPVQQKGNQRVIVQWLELRKIRVRVHRAGHRPLALRLWTSLLDPRQAPAQALAELYAQRWEHELYYRELKRQLRKSEVLQSHTLETGAQEIAALVLASALLARERARAVAPAPSAVGHASPATNPGMVPSISKSSKNDFPNGINPKPSKPSPRPP